MNEDFLRFTVRRSLRCEWFQVLSTCRAPSLLRLSSSPVEVALPRIRNLPGIAQRRIDSRCHTLDLRIVEFQICRFENPGSVRIKQYCEASSAVRLQNRIEFIYIARRSCGEVRCNACLLDKLHSFGDIEIGDFKFEIEGGRHSRNCGPWPTRAESTSL